MERHLVGAAGFEPTTTSPPALPVAEAAALLAISGDMKEAAEWFRLVPAQQGEMVASACKRYSA